MRGLCIANCVVLGRGRGRRGGGGSRRGAVEQRGSRGAEASRRWRKGVAWAMVAFRDDDVRGILICLVRAVTGIGVASAQTSRQGEALRG